MSSDGLRARIDAIEEAYEFMLAYAAQGRMGDEKGPGPHVREFLEKAENALDGLAEAATAAAKKTNGGAAGPVDAFLKILRDDTGNALSVVRFVLVEPAISSQLIDNLNASIHLRTLLTDLFLADEILKPPKV